MVLRWFVFKTLAKVFLNNVTQTHDLDIDVTGCEEFWNACFLHNPTGSVDGIAVITGGCNPKRSK